MVALHWTKYVLCDNNKFHTGCGQNSMLIWVKALSSVNICPSLLYLLKNK
jgi:hypothetical protein